MKTAKLVGLLLLAVVLLAFPEVVKNPAVTTVAVFTLLYAAAASAWNIFSGYSGYISLGHAAFFGFGSYALALICQHFKVPGGYLPFLWLPVVGLLTAVFALPLGWIALRVRRHAFVVITIAIFFVVQLMAYNLRSITNGSAGMELPIPLHWSGAYFNIPFYFVALLLLLVTVGVSWWIRN